MSKNQPLFVQRLSVFLFFRELRKIRPPARKKTGGKLWAGPPNDEGKGIEEGDEDKEGDGDGDVGGGWPVTKRAMATVAVAMATVAEAMATDTNVNKCRFFHIGVN